MESCRKHGVKDIAARRALTLIARVALAALCSGCATPHIHVLHDALTPAEHLELGTGYEKHGEFEPALRQYEQAAHGPLKSRALTCQGNVYFNRGQIAEAEKRYRRALRADADNAEALNNLAWLLAGEHRSLDEAERLARRALAQNPQPIQPYEDTLQTILKLKQE